MGYSVYTITCPISKEVVYIGLTKLNLNVRLKQHMFGTGTVYKKNWTNRCKKLGLYPTIDILDYSNSKMPPLKLELFWIHQFHQWGFILFNEDFIDNRYVKTKSILKERNIFMNRIQANYLSIKTNASVNSIMTSQRTGKSTMLDNYKLMLYYSSKPKRKPNNGH